MNKLDYEENGDRLIDGEQDNSYEEEGRGGGVEQKGKRTHGHGQQCGDCGVKGHKGYKW